MTREELYAKLWSDPKYLRLQERKDQALRVWNQLDAYKSHPRLAQPEKLKAADAAAKRALDAMYAYEEAVFAKGANEPSPDARAEKRKEKFAAARLRKALGGRK